MIATSTDLNAKEKIGEGSLRRKITTLSGQDGDVDVVASSNLTEGL